MKMSRCPRKTQAHDCSVLLRCKRTLWETLLSIDFSFKGSRYAVLISTVNRLGHTDHLEMIWLTSLIMILNIINMTLV